MQYSGLLFLSYLVFPSYLKSSSVLNPDLKISRHKTWFFLDEGSLLPRSNVLMDALSLGVDPGINGISGVRIIMALLGLPSTKSNHTNNVRRNIPDMNSISAAQMISITGITPEKPLIFCGSQNKSLPIIKQLIRQSHSPFVLLGTQHDFNEISCLRSLNTEWENNSFTYHLPEGNGLLALEPTAQNYLDLKECISKWKSHLIILCTGNGLQVDQELLNLLNSIGHYMILTDNLQRSVKSTDNSKMTAADLLSSMEYILISSIGTAAKDLLKVLPDFEYEKITNTSDFSLHQDTPNDYENGHHHRDGRGFRIGQSKTLESRCIITQEELIQMQDGNAMLIHNAHSSHTWVAQITG